MKIILLNPNNEEKVVINRDLIYGCWCQGNRVSKIILPPLHLLYIGSVLEREGFKVKLVDALADDFDAKKVSKIIDNNDIIIFSSSSTTFIYDNQFIKEIKINKPLIKVIMTGPQSTNSPESLKDSAIDFGVMKEVEEVLPKLINAISNKCSLKNISGVCFKEKDKIIVNKNTKLIENLNCLPFPNRLLIDNKDKYFHPLAKRTPFTTILSTRGCIGHCSFCTSPYFYNFTYRLRSPENVLEELVLIQKQGYKEILFRDETFTIKKDFVKKICEGIIKKKIDLAWSCNSRVGDLDEKLMRSMKQAGCHTLWFGVESGDQRILNNIKKGITVEMTEKTFMLARKVGLKTHAHITIGNPGETKETIKNTIKFIKKIKPTTIDAGITTPFPGSELYDNIVNKIGKIDNYSEKISEIHNKTHYNFVICNVSNDYLEKSIKEIYRKFYFRPNYIINQVLKVSSFSELIILIKSGLNVISYLK